jgi:hypothetical protein
MDQIAQHREWWIRHVRVLLIRLDPARRAEVIARWRDRISATDLDEITDGIMD